jgi:UDP-4-amino-4,6-dideoxy-N-acetyl-beta-L-altrosamine N-acetyltransferase
MRSASLRAITSSDLDMIRSWRNREDVRKFMYTRHEISKNEHQQWWDKVSQLSDSKYLLFEYNGVPNAVVSFSEINTKSENATWAFYLGNNAKRGLGSLVEYEAIQYAFESLGLHKLKCEVLEINPSVIKLHKKFGFKEEGVFREEHFYDSNYINVIRLAILDNDWQEIKESLEHKLKKVWDK